MPVDQPTDHPTGQVSDQVQVDQVDQVDQEAQATQGLEGTTLVPELSQGQAQFVQSMRRDAHLLDAEFNNMNWGITAIYDSPEVMSGQITEATTIPSTIERRLRRDRNRISVGVPRSYDHDGHEPMLADARIQAQIDALVNEDDAPFANQVAPVAGQLVAPIAVRVDANPAINLANQAEYQAQVPVSPRLLPIGYEIISLNNGRLPKFHIEDSPRRGLLAGTPLKGPMLRFNSPGERRDGLKDDESVHHRFHQGLARANFTPPPLGQIQQIYTVDRVPQGPTPVWCDVHNRYCVSRHGSSTGSNQVASDSSPDRSSGQSSSQPFGLDNLRDMLESFTPEQRQEAGIYLFDPTILSHQNPDNFNNTTQVTIHSGIGFVPGQRPFKVKGIDWVCDCTYDNFGRNWECMMCGKPPPAGYGSTPPRDVLEARRLAALNGTSDNSGAIGKAVHQAVLAHHPQQERYLGAAPMTGQTNGAGPSGFNGGSNLPRNVNGAAHRHNQGNNGNGDANGTNANGNGQANGHATINGHVANGAQGYQHSHGSAAKHYRH